MESIQAWADAASKIRSDMRKAKTLLSKHELSKGAMIGVLASIFGHEWTELAKEVVSAKQKATTQTDGTHSRLTRLYHELYADKAEEVTGNRWTPNGKPKSPQWAGKEGELLKRDLSQYGDRTLERAMRLFFSDKVDAARKFAREEQKAGYGYSVFHGQLERLVAHPYMDRYCQECGRFADHAPDCSVVQRRRQAEEEETQEIREEQEETGYVSIVEMFKKKRGSSAQEDEDE